MKPAEQELSTHAATRPREKLGLDGSSVLISKTAQIFILEALGDLGDDPAQ